MVNIMAKSIQFGLFRSM